MELFVPFLPFAFGALALGIGLVFRRQRLQGWQDAAAACGLQAVETSGWRLHLTAREGPLDVEIETCGNKGRRTRIVLRVQRPQNFRDVSIRREPLLRLGQNEIEIGDHAFDSTFLIGGSMRQVLALLDAETRRLIGRLNSEGRLEISNGVLRVEDLSDEGVPYVLPLLLDIGRRFAQPLNVPRRLAENARRDPAPGVRLCNLLVLTRELPRAVETLEALRAACSDPSPEIRLRAAKGLGAEGRGLLLDLAESLVDDAVSAEAVSILARELPFERMKAILGYALRGRSLQTARACLEALGHSGDPAAVDALAKVMALEKGDLAPAAALALGATGSPAAEPPLIEALQSDPMGLRVAAASALGRVGSVASVLPLQEAAEGSWLDRELNRAARQAIAEIQSRLQGASPGQLSLAGTEAGQLSLTVDSAGQISLTQAESGPGALSVEPFPLPPEEPEQPSRGVRKEPVVRLV